MNISLLDVVQSNSFWRPFSNVAGEAQINNPFPMRSSDTPKFYKAGIIAVDIVGIRYFPGRVAGKEKVLLARESYYPCNDNSITVSNLGGVQVGYVDPELASVLAPMMDSNLIEVEGIVPNPGFQDGMSEIQCHVHIYTRIEAFPFVKIQVWAAGLVFLWVNTPALVSACEAAVPAVVEKKWICIDPKKVDEIFESLHEKVKMRGDVAPLEPLKDVIKVELMPHQKEALGWLVERENCSELPPFWVVNDGQYVNELTGDKWGTRRPSPLRGGIFADDMGLGKTLTLLSLIAFDRRPLYETLELSDPFGVKRYRNWDDSIAKRPRVEISHVVDKRTTLVICPPSVLSTWMSQIHSHVHVGSMHVYMYYGERVKSVEMLKNFDIVLTTYSTLGAESRQSVSPLSKMKWWRIILDEAHTLKNVLTPQTLAVMNLQSERRWVVTGMPLQSNSIDIFTLLSFVRFHPFYHKKHWKTFIQRRLSRGDPVGESRLMVVLEYISLIRTKEKIMIELPPRVFETCFLELSSEELEVYNDAEKEAKNVVKDYISHGSVLRNYTNVLSLILRLRQICTSTSLCLDHIKCLIMSSNIEDVSNNPELLGKMIALLQEDEDLNCPICISHPSDVVITSCAHIFCRGCILKTLKCAKPFCPMCRNPLTESDLFAPPPEPSEQEEAKPNPKYSGLSSKGNFLMKLLEDSKEQNPTSKSVVFSQFRKMLLLLQQPLKDSGFKVFLLDWSMSAKTRAHVLQRYNECRPNAPTVLLASLKAFGAGINLTAASTVYLLEPWWNPLVEDQAIDRVHRIGQKETVKVVRIIAKNTIEERVLELQEKKRSLAKEGFGRKGSKNKREVNLDDISILMAV